LADYENFVAMRILLIDDEPDVLRAISEYLDDLGHIVYTAGSGAEALRTLQNEQIDIVVSDIKMPRMDGFDVLRQIKKVAPGTEVIMITGHGDIDSAVKAMREGAFDFFTKPVKLRELTASMERTVRFHRLYQEKERYRKRLEELGEQVSQHYSLDSIIGKSTGILQVKELITKVCETHNTSVLIHGETGTGKELIARALHWGSRRTIGPFIAVNCTAITESLAESEFFGHVKGAFTDAGQDRKGHFEQADGGTLFLDEIGDMSLAMQARLLRALEERRVIRLGDDKEISVDIRVVSATNRDLLEGVEQGRFREDLYYRLNAFAIRIPPVRDRREDILPIARFFLKKNAAEMRKSVADFSSQAVGKLENHPFPGNIRELRNLVERAVILCKDTEIIPADLDFDPMRRKTASIRANLNLEENEKELICQALERSGGNQVQAAKLLGVSRDTLRRRQDRYNLP